MATLQLPNTDARLTFLAIQYHLARPGSELDRESGRPADSGLTSVAAALEPQLDKAVAEIELTSGQQEKLDSAISGSINQLKTSQLLDAGGGTIPAFAETLRRLFPEAADDPEEALSLAGHMLQLRRRIAALVQPATTETGEEKQPPRWQVWKRRG